MVRQAAALVTIVQRAQPRGHRLVLQTDAAQVIHPRTGAIRANHLPITQSTPEALLIEMVAVRRRRRFRALRFHGFLRRHRRLLNRYGFPVGLFTGRVFSFLRVAIAISVHTADVR